MSVLAQMRANHDLDAIPQVAIALRTAVPHDDRDVEMHSHRKGQLVFALRGNVTCEVPSGLWIVPPRSGVWMPGGRPHRMRASAGTDLCLLCVEPSAASLPDECCTLSLSPLVREMILRLSTLPQAYEEAGATARLVGVMLEELALMPIERLWFPLSEDPRLRRIADQLASHPADRRTAEAWAASVALSERTLTRMVLRETGMSFGRWRQQLQIMVALKALYEGRRVQDIADDLGYESVSAFITMFRKALGKSPTKYLAETMIATS